MIEMDKGMKRRLRKEIIKGWQGKGRNEEWTGKGNGKRRGKPTIANFFICLFICMPRKMHRFISK